MASPAIASIARRSSPRTLRRGWTCTAPVSPYNQPETSVHYQQYDIGNLYHPKAKHLFYASQQYLVSAASKLPIPAAALGRRSVLCAVRIFEVFFDRPAAQFRLVRIKSNECLVGTLPADRGPAGVIASHRLQPGRSERILRCDLKAHPPRRLSLRLGRRKRCHPQQRDW